MHLVVGVFTSTSSSFAPHRRFRPMHRHQLLVFALPSVHSQHQLIFQPSSLYQDLFRPSRHARSLSIPCCVIQISTAYSHFAMASLSSHPHPSFRLSSYISGLFSYPIRDTDAPGSKISTFMISLLNTAQYRVPLR